MLKETGAAIGGFINAALIVALLVVSGTVRAASSVTISAPMAVETTPQPLLATGDSVRVAGDGTTWLAVYLKDGAVLARRIAMSGEAFGEPLAVSSTNAGSDPEVAFDGAAFRVAWIDAADDGSTTIFSRQVSVDGHLLGDPVALPGSSGTYVHIAMTQGELGTLLVAVSQADTRAWLVDSEGPHSSAPLSMPVGDFFDVSLGYSDGQYLATYAADNPYLARIGNDGAFLDQEPAAFTGLGRYPASIAAAKNGYRVVWSFGESIQSAAVSFDGAINLDPNPPITDADYDLFSPALVATDDGYLLAATEYNCRTCQPQETTVVYALTQTFQVLSSVQVGGDNESHKQLALGSEAAGAVVVWTDREHVAWSQAVSPSADNIGTGPFPLSFDSMQQTTPKAAPGPDGWLVAWTARHHNQNTGWTFQIAANLLNPTGNPTGAALVIHDGDQADQQTLIDVAGGSKGWLLATIGPTHELSTAFISSAGSIGEPQVLGSTTNTARFARASAGWALIWEKGTVLDETRSVVISTFEEGGALIATRELAAPSSQARVFDLAPIDDGYRAVWSTEENAIVGQRLDSAGSPAGDVERLATPAGVPFTMSFAAADATSWLTWALRDSVDPQAFTALPVAETFQRVPGDILSPLVAVRGAVATIQAPPPYPRQSAPVSLWLADEAEPLVQRESIDAVFSSHLSAKSNNRMLLSYSMNATVFGSRTERVFASIVEVMPGEDGGSGGVGVAGGSGEGPTTVEQGGGGTGAEGGIEGTEVPIGGRGVGGASTGGVPASSGDSGIEEGGAPAYAGGDPKGPHGRSRACGCRLVGADGSPEPKLGVMAAFVLVAWRRRSRRT